MTASHTEKECPFCDAGWVFVPDGAGCVDWDHCMTCDGKGKVIDDGTPPMKYGRQINPRRSKQ